MCEIQEKAANFQRYSHDKVIFNKNYAYRNDIVKILHRDLELSREGYERVESARERRVTTDIGNAASKLHVYESTCIY